MLGKCAARPTGATRASCCSNSASSSRMRASRSLRMRQKSWIKKYKLGLCRVTKRDRHRPLARVLFKRRRSWRALLLPLLTRSIKARRRIESCLAARLRNGEAATISCSLTRRLACVVAALPDPEPARRSCTSSPSRSLWRVLFVRCNEWSCPSKRRRRGPLLPVAREGRTVGRMPPSSCVIAKRAPRCCPALSASLEA